MSSSLWFTPIGEQGSDIQLAVDLAAMSRVNDQDDELVIIDGVEDAVVTATLIRKTPCMPVSIFTPAGRGSSRSASVAALMRSITGRSSLRSDRSAPG